ncbi:MAG: DivIVA domain-containing protein [Synergistetes bacterium]|nr:DivIVA domain-containing protein [Synergistota bacterium]MCX8127188.1 DivIVA domain-containing protein [Synergistota bacterium]MDW8191926.1 DivIVA domain-containing protein [Synergistota bacterium]
MAKLTPLDIQNKEFSRAFRGYREEEVDEFLDLIVEDYSALFRENAELKDRIKELENKISEYRKMESSMQEALLLAQKAAEERRLNAEREAEIIIKEAKLEAQRIIDGALAKLQEVERRIKELQKEKERFLLEMKALISTFWGLLGKELEKEQRLEIKAQGSNWGEERESSGLSRGSS